MPHLRHIASLWSLRDYPTADAPWGPEAQLDAIHLAGFDGVTGRVGKEHATLAKERNLIVVGFVSSSDEAEFARLLHSQREVGARQVNVQLADHDNGHHCQIPVTQRDGSLTHEFKDWLPFVSDTFGLWAGGNRNIEREIFVVPEMGPASSGYNLEGLPNSWEEACRLRPILQSRWQTACNQGSGLHDQHSQAEC
jgi:hypothetical protein